MNKYQLACSENLHLNCGAILVEMNFKVCMISEPLVKPHQKLYHVQLEKGWWRNCWALEFGFQGRKVRERGLVADIICVAQQ